LNKGGGNIDFFCCGIILSAKFHNYQTSMAMRTEISAEEAQQLHERNSKTPMDADTKVDFREIRDSWAEEGCLPEGISVAEIADEVRQKVTRLALGNRNDEHMAKVTDFMGKLSLLRKENLINESLYDQSIAILSGRGPKLRHND